MHHVARMLHSTLHRVVLITSPVVLCSITWAHTTQSKKRWRRRNGRRRRLTHVRLQRPPEAGPPGDHGFLEGRSPAGLLADSRKLGILPQSVAETSGAKPAPTSLTATLTAFPAPGVKTTHPRSAPARERLRGAASPLAVVTSTVGVARWGMRLVRCCMGVVHWCMGTLSAFGQSPARAEGWRTKLG